MHRTTLMLACLALAAPAAPGGESGIPRWHGGDTSVLAWPASEFSARERVHQAKLGGLSWIIVCNRIDTRAVTMPGAVAELAGAKTAQVTPIVGFRWRRPRHINGDVMCLAVDPDMPLPVPWAERVAHWARSMGGIQVLINRGKKPEGSEEEPRRAGELLERYAELLPDAVTFEAFEKGRWGPECEIGGTWDRLLARGRRLCIVGGTSSAGSAVLGRDAVATYVLCGSNSEEDVVNAIRAGRTVVAERDAIRLNFTVNGSPPGAVVVPKDEEVAVVVDARAHEPIGEIKVIGNVHGVDSSLPGDRIKVLHRVRSDAKMVTRAFKLSLDPGTRYLRCVVTADRGTCRTMTSPVFLGADAPKVPAADSLAQRLRLVGAAVHNLDWSNRERSLGILETLLADPHCGPPTAILITRSFDKPRLALIRPLLRSRQSVVRAMMLFVLYRTEGEAALPTILGFLDDRREEPRVYAARLLARFARREHLNVAIRAARDAWPEVRQYGLAALARIPGPKSLLRLRRALSDPVVDLRLTARAQLIRVLELTPGRRDAFIEGFKAGKVDAKLMGEAVARADLREMVAKVAEKPLGPETLVGTIPDTPDRTGLFRKVTASEAKVRPEIDGDPGDDAWARAFEATGFMTPAGIAAPHQTRVGVLYDDDNLYFRFQCEESQPQKMVKLIRERDGRVWLDDSVDVFICPTDRRHGKDPLYYHFSVNFLGTQFDAERRRAGWSAEWRAAADKSRGRWTVEMELPLRLFGRPKKNRTRWLINFVRRRRVKPEEESFFALGGVRSPSKYAELIFR